MAWGSPAEDQLDYEYSNDSDSSTEEDARLPSKQQVNDDDDDLDVDLDLSRAHGPSTHAEKRRVQNAIFDTYARERILKVTEKEVKAAIEGAKDESLSIRDILAKEENNGLITSSRDYQTELFQKAKEENIIAVLDTGSGKTHIATLLLRHIMDEELTARAKGCPNKIAFFLVNSVNLVFQQANVLRHGLDQNVEGICGAMGASLWDKTTWDDHFTKNMVVVSTAAVLVDCLMHSFINITGINLLIFDEAHHAKNNHPFARIIKDFYDTEPDISQRPRIFGMTASPVDANTDIKQAAKDLESLLHCKIATTSDLTLLQNHIRRPNEHVSKYSLQQEFETPFHQKIKASYGEIKAFQKFFKASKQFSAELGPWASDIYWSFAFSEEESRKIEMREERVFHKTRRDGSVDKLNEEIARLREAQELVRNHYFGLPTATLEDLSDKVLQLHSWLSDYYARSDEARCIVFVQQRQTARLLNLIFTHIGGRHLRSAILVGNSSGIGDQKVSLKTQVMTVAKFRRGELNCLFSTSVAEEGLDIPQCNLVVRFDLYRTMIAYVQSRGRARHRNSKYLHMLEDKNTHHQMLLLNARNAEHTMRAFCNNLPKDRLLNDVDNDAGRLLATETDFPIYKDPDSGAKLTYRSSLSVLAHFVASLPPPNLEACLQPTYVIGHSQNQFVCEVILPEFAPIVSMKGRPERQKILARCSAAFSMCIELRKKNYLDQNLLPTVRKQVPAMRNALLALSAKSKDLYKMRIKPEFWQFGYGTVPEHLYLTVVDVDAGLERPHQPLGLLTRTAFPQMPSFPIYLKDGQASNVISTGLLKPLTTTEEYLDSFTKFTLQIYDDIFNKGYEYDVSKMWFWLVPIRTDSIMSPSTNPEHLIDMEQVKYVCENGEYRWTRETSHDALADRYIVDRGDGGRRFYSVKVVPDLKVDDPIPGFAPKYKSYNDSILDYSCSLWKSARTHRMPMYDRSQPVFEAEKIPFRRNLLAAVENDEDEAKVNWKAYLCPEPFKISALSTRFVAICYVFPAIIHRFESCLIAMDACALLGLDIGPRLALEALTKDSENSDEHGEEQVNFKSGMGPNYERLEFMGDCFLKMATSISTFVQQPDENEFEFHVRRMLMLCNQNLKDAAIDYKLYEYVRTMAFSRRTWYPDGLVQTKGKGMKKTGPQVIKHSLGDKTIADVCEAFIGAAFMQHNKLGAGENTWNPETWDVAVKAVTLLVKKEDHLVEKFSDYYAAYVKPRYQMAVATASQLDMARQIEAIHPYHFKYPRLLRSAFIHPCQGFMWEEIPDYQRLEFLGDSLLDQVFVMDMFYRFPEKDPQWLTEHKMPMVSNKFLGALCTKLGFHRYIRHNSAKLTHDIQSYIEDLEQAEKEAKGVMTYWDHTPENPPKCLADVVEAYVGAMFVDSEFDFTVVQTFFDMHIKRFYVDMSLYDDFAGKNPRTRLKKLLEINFGCKESSDRVSVVPTVIPGARDQVIAMVAIHGVVKFDHVAESARYARVKVAKTAMKSLEGLPPFEFKKQYGCDCKDDEMDEEFEEKVKQALAYTDLS
ncbi:dicer-like protein-like protein 1 [Massariosphaeria phaeospora]|uniref:Dicer-like protein 1 n=1 Tax=Massariosphaeria phaeospora TaxID=100035 RepID=A0A7C8IAI3_9PLEO|nr:dicer-like protein-like protein 1 [Massariosphaeria phaeospora]